MVNKIVVGAHYGLKDWMAQRATAVVMIVFTVVMAIGLIVQQPAGFEAWRAYMSQGWVRFASFLFVVALLYHAWVGVRDIWMDYCPPPGLRLFMHTLTIVLLTGYAGWAIQVLWRL